MPGPAHRGVYAVKTVLDPKDVEAALMRGEARFRDAIGRGIRNGARRGRAHLVRKTPKDNDLLKAAWRDTTSHGIAATRGVVAEVFNDAPYAGVVEMGARPHPVSMEGQMAIYEWVRRNIPISGPLAPAGRTNRARSAAFLDASRMSRAHWDIAQAIVWRIRTKGQKPTYFVRGSLPGIQRFTIDEVLRSLRQFSRDENGTTRGKR